MKFSIFTEEKKSLYIAWASFHNEYHLGCVHIEIYGIRYTVFAIRYTLFGIRYMVYGHGGSHRSSTCFQCALFVSIKKVANSVF